MLDRNVLRGPFLAAVALAFGLSALRYRLGDFSRPGPGLFPLLVSGLLLLVALLTIAQSRLETAVPLSLNARNIGLVLLGLASFAALSKWLDMALGIVALVFIAGLAGTSYSWKRNLVICAVLLAVAFAFQRLLGLNLPLL